MRHGLCCTLILLAALPAAAFDGERTGFVVGGGAGAALSFVGQDLEGARLDEFTRFGGAFDLRAGWGFSPAVQLFASLKGSWIRYDTQQVSGSDVAHGTLGLAMVQHFEDGRSDWYSTGHLGLAYFDLLEEDIDALLGFGFGAGLGCEWRRGLACEFLAGWESTSTDAGELEFGVSTITLRLQLLGMLY